MYMWYVYCIKLKYIYIYIYIYIYNPKKWVHILTENLKTIFPKFFSVNDTRNAAEYFGDEYRKIKKKNILVEVLIY